MSANMLVDALCGMTDEQREEITGKLCSDIEDMVKSVNNHLPYMVTEAMAKETESVCRMVIGKKGGGQ